MRDNVFVLNTKNQSINANHRLVDPIVSNPKPWIVNLRKNKGLPFSLPFKVCVSLFIICSLFYGFNWCQPKGEGYDIRVEMWWARVLILEYEKSIWKPSIETLRNQIILFDPIPFSSSIAIDFNNRYGRNPKSIVGWGNKWIN